MSGSVINQLLLFVVPRWQPGSCKNRHRGLVTYGKGYQEDQGRSRFRLGISWEQDYYLKTTTVLLLSGVKEISNCTQYTFTPGIHSLLGHLCGWQYFWIRTTKWKSQTHQQINQIGPNSKNRTECAENMPVTRSCKCKSSARMGIKASESRQELECHYWVLPLSGQT